MMGQHDRSEALFYYFRLEDHVPDTHLLRLIEKHISFAFVRERGATDLAVARLQSPACWPRNLVRCVALRHKGSPKERSRTEAELDT